MTMNRRSVGGPSRRAPEPRSWARPPGLALLALALVGLAQAGCRSVGCNNCSLSGIGSKVTHGVQAIGARVFHHGAKGCGTCGEGGVVGGQEEGTIVDSGIPVAPGGMVVPSPATIVPPPATESAPTELYPLPGTSNGNNPGGTQPANPAGGSSNANPATSRGAPTNKPSGYEANLPRNSTARRGTSGVARALHSRPEPARPADAPGESDDLLANIPPVDVPTEVTRKAAALPGRASNPPSSAAVPGVAPAPAPAPAEPVSAAEGAAGVPSVAGRHSPGIRRSSSVAPTLGGGSAPSADGLDWLKEKGYKTFLDLRSSSEIDPNFAEAVNDHGMFYLSLPIVANRLDPSRLARFDDLIARKDNRPLYFCDTDGTRAGLVWYIHLRVVEGDDAQSASQKAEELGLTEIQARLGEAYLAALKPRPRPVEAAKAAPNAPPVAPEPDREAAPSPSTGPPGATPAASPAAESPGAASDTPPAPMLPGGDRPQASMHSDPDGFRDPAAWKTVAALVLTGIGLPVAYLSKSVLSGARSTRRRASLPAAERRSLGLPPGSDA